jgi:hypothetical protein
MEVPGRFSIELECNNDGVLESRSLAPLLHERSIGVLISHRVLRHLQCRCCDALPTEGIRDLKFQISKVGDGGGCACVHAGAIVISATLGFCFGARCNVLIPFELSGML